MRNIKYINVLGDSITWGYNPLNTITPIKNSFVNIINKKLNATETRNYGIIGSCLADNNLSYEPMCKRYDIMDSNADLVIVFGGINDFVRDDFNVELGNIDDSDNKTVYGALNTLCKGLKSKYKDSMLLFLTPLKMAYTDDGFNLLYSAKKINNRNYEVKDVSDAIKNVCKLYDINVLDLFSKLKLSKEEILKYMPDGIHPTEEYHKVIANEILEYLNKI